MNLDALWQRNRRYVLGFAGGVLTFFLLLWLLTRGASARQESAGRAVAKATTDLRSAHYDEKREREAAAQLATLRERTAAFAALALPPLREPFRLPAGKAAAQHYIEVTGELRQELVAWALRNDCEVDASLGLPAVSPTQAPQVERVLHGLDVVERVVRLAVEHGARAVERITIAEAQRRSGGRAALLDLAPVQLEVVFVGRSPEPFLRALLDETAAGRPLGLAGLEVAALIPRRQERRLLLDFAVGSLPPAAAAEVAQ